MLMHLYVDLNDILGFNKHTAHCKVLKSLGFTHIQHFLPTLFEIETFGNKPYQILIPYSQLC